jgi:protocatechuate 3,4-dioxygenase beta subunit
LTTHEFFSRRGFARRLALSTGLFAAPGAFAEALRQTADMTEGPFYPDKLPLDTDNDLLIINNGITPAVGEITYLSGRILTSSGEPVRNAFVEIWQVDGNGSYLHTQGQIPAKDGNFQGYGRFMTDSRGQYYFRTVKPVPYRLQGVFRTPHIHVAVSKNGHRLITTQVHIKGHPDNAKDGLLQRIKDPKALATVMADFKPVAGAKLGELAANFDVVMGKTLRELEDGKLGISKSTWTGQMPAAQAGQQR